ncbi:MAG: NAD(P)H-dependent oxidoreductase [Polyangiaceae bacterium]|nr:NAD(P)H-dependent oxidoreductase [Polyangiaceae bacterium]
MKILILFAHPALERSRVNRRLVAEARAVTGVTVHDLYEAYPDMHVDVRREKELLLEHDAVIFQHPFFWYSTPALLKEWQDLVLQHGWAYGSGGRALAGKVTFNAVTTGGPESSYNPEGYNRFTVRQLLAPYEATARLCSMRYLPPFITYAALRLADTDAAAAAARDYRRLLEALAEARIDFERAAKLDRLNADLDALLDALPDAAASGG